MTMLDRRQLLAMGASGAALSLVPTGVWAQALRIARPDWAGVQ